VKPAPGHTSARPGPGQQQPGLIVKAPGAGQTIGFEHRAATEPQRAPLGAPGPQPAGHRTLPLRAAGRRNRGSEPRAAEHSGWLGLAFRTPATARAQQRATGGDRRTSISNQVQKRHRFNEQGGTWPVWPTLQDRSASPAAWNKVGNRLEAGRVLSRSCAASLLSSRPGGSWFCKQGIGPAPRPAPALASNAHVGHHAQPGRPWASELAPTAPAMGRRH